MEVRTVRFSSVRMIYDFSNTARCRLNRVATVDMMFRYGDRTVLTGIGKFISLSHNPKFLVVFSLITLKSGYQLLDDS